MKAQISRAQGRDHRVTMSHWLLHVNLNAGSVRLPKPHCQGHLDPMVDAVDLVALRELLMQSLAIADTLGDTHLGAVIDTALQETTAKIQALKEGG